MIPKQHRGKAAAGAVALVTASLVAFIHAREGVKLRPYKDIVGVWTVCAGVTGKHVIPGKLYTREECAALDSGAIEQHGQGLMACVHQPLRQNQYEALASWTYNVGVNAACASTLVRHINDGMGPSVFCNDLMAWDRAGRGAQRRIVQGLKDRREIERDLCLRGGT